jgi:hypothetical protein
VIGRSALLSTGTALKDEERIDARMPQQLQIMKETEL